MRCPDLARVTALWREGVEREREVDGDDPLRARRRLHASRTFDGMVRLDGDLDPECGETLLHGARRGGRCGSQIGSARIGARRRSVAPTRSVRSVASGWTKRTAPPWRPNDRTSRSRSTWARSSIRRSGPVELDHVGVVHAAVARRLACDASVRRVVTAGTSQPLDVGRRTPVVSPADPPRRHRARPSLPLPRLRPAAHLVRRAPRAALGRRRLDVDREPRVALPPSPPADPHPCRLPGHDGGRTPDLPTTRRHPPRRSRAAVNELSHARDRAESDVHNTASSRYRATL